MELSPRLIVSIALLALASGPTSLLAQPGHQLVGPSYLYPAAATPGCRIRRCAMRFSRTPRWGLRGWVIFLNLCETDRVLASRAVLTGESTQ